MRVSGLSGRPVIFGEVLFDTFPDGHAALGGAPFNVAWHLAGFGLAPLFISCVGEDEQGDRVRAVMQDWHMDAIGLQRSRHHPTGKVAVSIVNHEPHFDILADQAYDHIDAGAVRNALTDVQASLIYHGSLIARGGESGQALHAAIEAAHAPVFVDVNLRPPWWQRQAVEAMLMDATWAKLNHGELAALSGCEDGGPAECKQAAEAFRTRFNLAALVVTFGAAGALFLTDAGEAGLAKAEAVRNFQDSVGAGDAFAAVTILGLQRGWPWRQILERAQAFAAAVCAIRGATSPDEALYRKFLRRWGESG